MGWFYRCVPWKAVTRIKWPLGVVRRMIRKRRVENGMNDDEKERSPEDDQSEETSSSSSEQSDSEQGPSTMNELRSACIRAFRAAVAAVQPYERVRDALRVNGCQLTVGKRVYQLQHNVHVAAIGKAALGMVQGAEASLGKEIVEGIASVPRMTIKKIPPESHMITEFYEGATNNLPDEDACINAERIENMARRLRDPNDIFLVLLSGGGSALLPAPVNSISLADKLATIKAMTARGADIKQLNCVRRALSRLKGGKLAEIAHPAKIIAVIVSDIVGDPIDLIASGPTVIEHYSMLSENPTKVLKKLHAWEVIPPNVQQALQRASATRPANAKVDVQNTIICNNETAIKGVSKTLEGSGYSCHIASTTVAQDATLFGEQLAGLINSILGGMKPEDALRNLDMTCIDVNCPDDDRLALLFGGETTVTLTGKGKGGRNQQIVLSALSKLLEDPDTEIKGEFALLSAGTDGQDGPTDAAGAVLTSDDIKYIHDNGRWEKGDVDGFLRKNDSFNFWKVFRDGVCHVNTGPTGTNVMDVQVLLINKKVNIFTL
uniref:Glycerate kinase n=1 Tax=Parascaris univalens TaxID=6257 RepID=A0A915AMS0_PARUN